LDALIDNSTTPGLYVVQNSDSGNIKRFEGGTNNMAMTWLGREELSTERPNRIVTWQRARVDSNGSSNITFSTRENGAAAVSQKTISNSGTRSTTRFWFTAGTNKPSGQRLAAQIVTTASDANAAVHRVEIDQTEDGS
jgi:hypothetical protein